MSFSIKLISTAHALHRINLFNFKFQSITVLLRDLKTFQAQTQTPS